MNLLIDWDKQEIHEISGNQEFPRYFLSEKRNASRYKCNITLTDVLCFLKTAKDSELRSVQIALGAKSLKGKSKLNHFIYWKKEAVKGFFRSVFHGLFYVRSFRVVSLSLVNRVKTVDLCTKANYNVMDIQFKRKSFYYFQMLHKGNPTGWGYFIDAKEID